MRPDIAHGHSGLRRKLLDRELIVGVRITRLI
jgi:hypothetical protein